MVGPGTTVIEASSGSTAVSEAYFARMIGLPFVAVMAKTTSPEKIMLIERQGCRCHLADDASQVNDVAREMAEDLDGHEPLRSHPPGLPDADRRSARQHRHPHVRPLRALRPSDDDAWLAAQGLDLTAYLHVLERAWTTGEWTG